MIPSCQALTRPAALCLFVVSLSYPHLGLAAEYTLSPGPGGEGTIGDFSSLQDALDQAQDGDVIYLMPGEYKANLQFPRRSVELRGDPGANPEEIVLDGSECIAGAERCSVMAFDWSNQGGNILDFEARPILSNMTLRGGRGTNGIEFDDNYDLFGGGALIIEADPLFDTVIIEENHLQTLGRSYFEKELDGTGAGVFLYQSFADFLNVTIRHNTVVGDGLSADGGGVHAYYSEVQFTNGIIHDNYAHDDGGGIYMWGGRVDLTQTTVVGNTAGDLGGGVFMRFARSDMSYSIVGANLAPRGNNIYGHCARATVESSIFWDLDDPQGTGNVGFRTNNGSTYTLGDPLFYNGPVDGAWGRDDDLHLRPGSAGLDAGPANGDADGTAQDIGAYGGAFSRSGDRDGDGMPDDWEATTGLDPEVAGSETDTDEDGVRDSEEFALGTSPTLADTDGDGRSDSEEIQDPEEPTDPRDFFNQGSTYERSAQVPQDFPTVQEAIDAVYTQGHIVVEPGIYEESLRVVRKDVVVESADTAEQTWIRPEEGDRPLWIQFTPRSFVFQGFTLTGGKATIGGGVMADGADGLLSSLVIEGNEAIRGGGAFFNYSRINIADSRIEGNVANSTGGGLYLRASRLDIEDSDIIANLADLHVGGGLALEFGSSADVTGTTFAFNEAGWVGGGLFAGSDQVIKLLNTEFYANLAEHGGGAFFGGSPPEIVATIFVGNVASRLGGAIVASTHGWGKLPNLLNTTVVGNEAGEAGGGFFLLPGSLLGLDSSIVAYNSAPNGANAFAYSPKVEDIGAVMVATYSLFYTENHDDPSGTAGVLVPAVRSLVKADPKFVAFNAKAPLAPGMSLRLELGSPALDRGNPGGAFRDPGQDRNDMGSYGGPYADNWDRDRDGLVSAYWPGAYTVPPPSIDALDFDCADRSAMAAPGQLEQCDGVDNDCDGVTDEGEEDADFDGTADCADDDGDGLTEDEGDCDDRSAYISPEQDADICDGADNDCDGVIDEDASDDLSCDQDGDGYSPSQGDCDDSNPDISPSATEICNGVDDDCNGIKDDDPSDGQSLYVDEDGDGFGDPYAPVTACPGPHLVDNDLDCNDGIAWVNPEANDLPFDGLDNDCDGTIDEGR